MDYQAIVKTELSKSKISICLGQCNLEGHKRGFVIWDEPVIHLDSKIATRSTLHRFFHELGHAVLQHKSLRSYQRESEAERYAFDKFREYGIPLPRKSVALGKKYVARKRRHGNNIINGKVNTVK